MLSNIVLAEGSFCLREQKSGYQVVRHIESLRVITIAHQKKKNITYEVSNQVEMIERYPRIRMIRIPIFLLPAFNTAFLFYFSSLLL